MPKYIALLRAINVGGHTVKMDRLRRLFEELKFSKVETFIASGNVIFNSTSKSTAALEKKIETHLHAELGYPVATFIRSITELAAVANSKPFPASDLNADGNFLYIGFTKVQPNAEAKRKLLGFTTAIDKFHVGGREVYWLCRKKSSDSDFSGAVLEKTLSMPATFRNVTTVRRLMAQYS